MAELTDNCQYKDLAEITLPDHRSGLSFRKHWWRLKKYMWYLSVLGPISGIPMIIRSSRPGKFMSRNKAKAHFSNANGNLGLKPGDWVRVKTAKEIFATLDANGKLRGLAFNPEMTAFCGKRFKVFKVLNRMIDESTGELRTIKTPTVFLEEVFCDGKSHGGCDRSCFHFWREAWLERSLE